MNNDYNSLIPEFNLRNSELAFLVAEAAIDIDNHLAGRSQEDASVIHLSHLLNKITQGENPSVKLPDNYSVLVYAISGRENAKKYWEGKSSDEIVPQTKLIAEDLRNFKNLSKSRQIELSDFCVNLSRETAHHNTEYFSRQPSPRKSRLVA